MRPKIILIEDNAFFQMAWESEMENHADVVTYSTPKDFEQEYASVPRPIDFIICDYMFKEEEGNAVSVKAKALAEGIPFALCTNATLSSEETKTFGLVIGKEPISFEELKLRYEQGALHSGEE